MIQSTDHFRVRFAETDQDIESAQKLRYEVFVEELGGKNSHLPHPARLECDRFDTVAQHLLLCDNSLTPEDQVVGVYRLMSAASAEKTGGFYSQSEFDIAKILTKTTSVLELGRSCLAPAYRGGIGMMLLWQFLARYIKEQGIEILFGVASFQNSDPRVHALPLAYLQAHYLADDDIRPSALVQEPINYATQAELQAKQALQQMPALIKAYLRLGGKVGEGIYVDHAFNTTDVCMVLKTEDLLTRSKLFYPEGAPFD